MRKWELGTKSKDLVFCLQVIISRINVASVPKMHENIGVRNSFAANNKSR